jgi:hypothetical protein
MWKNKSENIQIINGTSHHDISYIESFNQIKH